MNVYAIDFDGTLCENAWPEIGSPKMNVIDHFRELKKQGHKLILNTCREGKLLDQAIAFCSFFRLEFDAHNENLPELIEQYGGDCRKISADYYIDDKNLFVNGVNGYIGIDLATTKDVSVINGEVQNG